MKNLCIILVSLVIYFDSFAQDAKSLNEKIVSHYDAIVANDLENVYADHLDEITLYTSGKPLMDIEEMSNFEFPELKNAKISNFEGKIIDNVGIALFRLTAEFGEVKKTLNVTAVWVWQDGNWRELHHHESELKE